MANSKKTAKKKAKPAKKTTPRRKGEAVRARSAPAPLPPRPGRKHTKPLALLYREGHRVCAALVQPGSSHMPIKVSSGVYACLGVWMDAGYAFGPVREVVPDWARAKLSPECKAIGVCNITGFPLK